MNKKKNRSLTSQVAASTYYFKEAGSIQSYMTIR